MSTSVVRPVLRGPGSPVDYVEIPRGVAGTRATLDAMAELARDASGDPRTGAAFVDWARAIVREANVASKDQEGELRALFAFVRASVRYRYDPRGVERVQAPYWTLAVDGAGDCDDVATLLAALALALGHGAAIRAVAVDPSRPGQYSHVYALLGCARRGVARWFPCDATQLHGPRFGWEPPRRRWLLPAIDRVVARP